MSVGVCLYAVNKRLFSHTGCMPLYHCPLCVHVITVADPTETVLFQVQDRVIILKANSNELHVSTQHTAFVAFILFTSTEDVLFP